MYTIAAITAAAIFAYAGYKIYQNWPRVNSVSDIQEIFKNYNSVDDLKAAYESARDDAQARITELKANLDAEVKAAEDKVTALKSLVG